MFLQHPARGFPRTLLLGNAVNSNGAGADSGPLGGGPARSRSWTSSHFTAIPYEGAAHRAPYRGHVATLETGGRNANNINNSSRLEGRPARPGKHETLCIHITRSIMGAHTLTGFTGHCNRRFAGLLRARTRNNQELFLTQRAT
jgi:hypothetical protein